MRNVAKHGSLFLCIQLMFLSVDAQVVDNSGKDIFVVKNTGGISFPFSSNSVAFNFTGSMNASDSFFINKKRFDRLNGNDTRRRSVIPHPKQAGAFLLIRKRDNHFKSFYIPSIAEDSLKSVVKKSDTARKTVEAILGKPLSAGLTELDGLAPGTFHQIVQRLNNLGLVKGWHTATDMGRVFQPVFFNFKVSNLSFKVPGDFFTSANQPTITAEIGFVQNATLRFDNWKNLSQVKTSFLIPKEYDVFYSVFINANCIRYYDTINKAFTPTTFSSIGKFIQAGVKLNANLYYTKSFAAAITLLGSYGLPIEGFKSYQGAASLPIAAGVPDYFKLGTAGGKYGGDINGRIWNGRFSLAFPIFLNFFRRPDPSKNGSGSVYIVPSFASFGSKKEQWTQQLGISLNLLGKPYGGTNSTIVQGGGIGMDFLSDPNMKTGWGSALFYITGTLNLGAVVTQFGNPVTKSK